MKRNARGSARSMYLILGCCLVLLTSCTTIPRKYLSQAQPGVTLTQLVEHPTDYQDKVVVLGGTRLGEEERDGHVWLHLRNRPLDKEYKPHLPRDRESEEGGTYWVAVTDRSEFPPQYRHWARMTVVGRVMGWTNESDSAPKEPVLGMMYLRGWGLNTNQDGAWEQRIDPNYMLTTPRGLLAPRQQRE